MPTEPTNNQPVIPFKMPHLTPVLDGPSPLVPDSAAFLNLQIFLTEKTNLEFIPVKARTLEQRARLVVVKGQCVELEKQVVLERMEAQIANLRQEIIALNARPRKHGRKPAQIGARTRKQRLADREAIAAKQAELSKLEAAHAQLRGVAKSAELHPLTRNQFLKMVGMTVLAFTVWNEATAYGYTDDLGSGSFSSGGSLTSGSLSWSEGGCDEEYTLLQDLDPRRDTSFPERSVPDLTFFDIVVGVLVIVVVTVYIAGTIYTKIGVKTSAVGSRQQLAEAVGLARANAFLKGEKDLRNGMIDITNYSQMTQDVTAVATGSFSIEHAHVKVYYTCNPDHTSRIVVKSLGKYNVTENDVTKTKYSEEVLLDFNANTGDGYC